MRTQPKNVVTQVSPQSPGNALEHFESKLGLETDCWDVHSTQEFDERGFLLIDARSPQAFSQGHLPGALNIPHAQLDADRLQEIEHDVLFVVYCAGPHCNAATRAAIRLAQLGRPVKEMVGGITGWIDEGFELMKGD